MHPVLKVAGVVHIWYYIPLCTIFSQKFNNDVSEPNSMIPKQGLKIQHPFQRRTLQLISLAIHGSYQKTIQGSQPPGPAGAGLEVQFRIIKRGISQGHYIIAISCQGSKYFSIPWTIQLVHTGNTQVSCMALAQLGQFIPTVAIQSHSLVFKMSRTVFAQFRQYSW
ncbi:hypothetical protein O181_124925 [Austropuccinia psidii MF-1]|uniref:Uncharacterized protein n=1 Tax=Austropuccinia psidii MF-1 TaxID=1389203 RepID=A0A9Q3KNS9_9BASI|nr:hypothetical protein [Austropuccinia psidii MF-1]